MASPAPLFSRFRFGAFELDAASGELRKAGIPIKLRLQAIQVLLMLTERAGQLVTREEIRERLWSADTFVDFERGINFCINQIRGALGDDAEKPRYVKTLPRRGYRFIASVTLELPREPALSFVTKSTTTEIHRGTSKSNAGSSASSGIQVVSGHLTQTALRLLVTGIVILAALAIGFSTYRWLSGGKKLDLQNMQITKLTNSGSVADVAISPDGRYVIYAQGEGEKQGLRLRQVATRSDVQILPPETMAFHGLTFSPDGNYIYFVRAGRDDPFFKYLYAMPALGGDARKLITDVDSPISFSPDGHQLVYEHCVQPRNEIEVKITDPDGSSERLLAILHNASCWGWATTPGPNWSPDGRTIAVPVLMVGKQQRWLLDMVRVADGTVHELYSSADRVGRAVWLPSGNALIAPRSDPTSHRSQLATILFPSGEVHPLTSDLSDYNWQLDTTKDGKTVVATAQTTDAHIWIVPSGDASKARQITSDKMPMFDIAESLDGRLLSVSDDGTLWVMNGDGSQLSRFSDVPNTSWLTPCDHFVVFSSDEPGTIALTRIDANGMNPVKLVSGNLWSPTCAADGKFVFYVNLEYPQKIWRIPVERGTPVEIADILGSQITGRLSVSPDGEFLAYPYTKYGHVSSPGWNLAVIPASGGAPVKTFEFSGGFWGPRWSPNGKGLQYLLDRDGATNLWEQPLAGGAPKQLTKFTSGRIFNFNWTADSKQLLLSRGEITSDVVLLSNLR